MTVRVIAGPAPIVTPTDVPGSHAADDAQITALIAAVQAGIDGPTGWLGRSLGEQVLEYTRTDFRYFIRLPYQPAVDVESVKYRDREGVERELESSFRVTEDGVVFGGAGLPVTDGSPDAVRITYKAGYADSSVPRNAKQAVILGVQLLRAMSEQSTFLRSESVEGVGSTTYAMSEAAEKTVRSAMELMLQPLRVYWL